MKTTLRSLSLSARILFVAIPPAAALAQPTYNFTEFAGSSGHLGTTDGAGASALFSSPHAIVVDGAGVAYVTDERHAIRRIASDRTVTTLAGISTVPGFADGIGSTARFNRPGGLALDAAGNLYVADTGNHTIRRVTPIGIVSTLAGVAGFRGSADGTLATALFDNPATLALDSGGNLYVTESRKYTIRKITPDGTVTTLPGLTGSPVSADSLAGFNGLTGIAVDATGNLFVINTERFAGEYGGITPVSAVYKITPTGEIHGVYVGATPEDVTYNGFYLAGLAFSPSGDLLLTNNFAANLRIVSATGAVNTLTIPSWRSWFEGESAAFNFNRPEAIAVDSAGNLYVADSMMQVIWQGTTGQQRTFPVGPTITAQPQSQTVTAGTNVTLSVTASSPSPLSYQWYRGATPFAGATGPTLQLVNTQPTDGGSFSVAVTSDSVSVRSDTATVAVNAAPSNPIPPAAAAGTSGGGGAVSPWMILALGALVALCKFKLAGASRVNRRHLVLCLAVWILMGRPPVIRANVESDWYAALTAVQKEGGQTLADQSRAAAIVRQAMSYAREGISGNPKFQIVAECVPAGVDLGAAVAQAAYVTSATLYPAQISALQTQLVASLAGLAVSNQAIDNGCAWGAHVAEVLLVEREEEVFLNSLTLSRRETRELPPRPARATPGGAHDWSALTSLDNYAFTTLAGVAGLRGSADGTGIAAQFDYPTSIAVDRDGGIYVADQSNHTIRKITAAGAVTTFAGLAGNGGSSDGVGNAARFYFPTGLAVDSAGNIYVADQSNHTIRKITPTGVVSTLAGSPGQNNSTDGVGSAARFSGPIGIAVDGAGNLLVTEGYYPEARIRQITPGGIVSTLAIKFPYGPMEWPKSIEVDGAGNIYVLDYGELGSVLWKIPPGQTVASRVSDPSLGTNPYPSESAITVDRAGNLLVAYSGGQIRRFIPGGVVQAPTATGNYGESWDLAADESGNLYSLPADYSRYSHTVQIGVVDPNGPVITKQPESESTWAGERVVFRVEAAGYPNLTYQWLRNSETIAGANVSTLTLDKVQPADAGSYTVVVSNGTKSVTSRTAMLTVNIPISAPPSSGSGAGASANGSSGGGATSPGLVLTLGALVALRRLKSGGGIGLRARE